MIAFLWSVYGLMRQTITFGTMTSFLQLVVRIQRPMSDLMSLLPSIISAKSSLDRLVDLLAYKTEERSNKKVLDDIECLRAEGISETSLLNFSLVRCWLLWEKQGLVRLHF